MTPDQLSVYSQMLGTGLGNVGNVAGSIGAGQNILGTGTNAATNALAGLGAFNPLTLNNPSTITNNAIQYASGGNQYVPGAVAQAMLPAVQTARDVQLPGIEADAAGTGNINSSRTGIAQGLVTRGLAENAQNLGASLMNSNYQTGLSLAQNQALANNQQTLSALTAAMGGGSNMIGLGNSTTNSGIDSTGNLYNMGLTGASGPQVAQQLQLQNQLQQFQASQNNPFMPWQNLMSIVGTNNWGGTTDATQTTHNNPSVMSTIGSLLGAGGSLIGSKGGPMGGGSGLLGLGLPLFSMA
jgi:hypothetical protein